MDDAQRTLRPGTSLQPHTRIHPAAAVRACPRNGRARTQPGSGPRIVALPGRDEQPSVGFGGSARRHPGRPNASAEVAELPTAPGDRSAAWLRAATAGLAVLAGAAAAVSFTAQYRMIFAAKQQAVIAGLEAAIPDASALIFASLGIALALHGRRAVRARVLNVAAVGTSVFMNVLAAGPGWRGAAIWAMPPVAYALASDTMIGVVRARAIAVQRALNVLLADDDVTPLALAGGAVLWLLRLTLAPGSTLSGFRRWVLEECPVAPGRKPGRPRRPKRLPARSASDTRALSQRTGTKTARFLDLVEHEHGPLAGIPVERVSRISSAIAPRADLNTGAARTALRRAVLAARREAQPA